MPRAHGAYAAQNVYYWQHQDLASINQAPPVQNTWYTIVDDTDVRFIEVYVTQTNDEAAAKDVEFRFTLDGQVHTRSTSLPNNTNSYVYIRLRYEDLQFIIATTEQSVGRYVDLRALAGKIEVRMTSVPGTNQVLRATSLHEKYVVT